MTIENAEEVLRRQRQMAVERHKRYLKSQKEKYGRKQRLMLMTDDEYQWVKDMLRERREEEE